jgi:hypothetical protein
MVPIKTLAEPQRTALVDFFKTIDAIDYETLSDEDFARLENNRVNFRRKLNL